MGVSGVIAGVERPQTGPVPSCIDSAREAIEASHSFLENDPMIPPRLLLATCLALLPAAAIAAAPTKATSAWWGHVAVLASDELAGRLTGTPGYLNAANYVAQQFKAAGLQPGGDGGSYLQAVAFTEQTVDAARSSFALTTDGVATPLAIGPQVLLPARETQPTTIAAPLVFIGYGIHLPEAGHDDFAGLDLKGKVVVVVGGGPAKLSAALKSHASAYAFPKAIAAAGAIGIIRLQNPRTADIPWARQIALSSQGGMQLAEPALRNYPGTMFTATMNPANSEALFVGSGRTFAEVLALVDAQAPLPRFDLKVGVKATVAAKVRSLSSPNVVGILLGRDPALKSQYVVLSAHLDHLGVGTPIDGDAIYNGAMDNAAGIATMIETARSFRARRERPRRSLVFVAVGGEEKGLLGSRAFAEGPTVPKPAIVANINMDMFLPLFPLKNLLVFGDAESSLGPDARAVATAQGYGVLPDPAPDRNLFVRSDQYSFVRTGVPAIALKMQPVPGSPEAQIEKDFLRLRYHAPQDDLSQPVDLAAADAFNKYLAALTLRVANAEARPRWNADSFFKRFEAKTVATR